MVQEYLENKTAGAVVVQWYPAIPAEAGYGNRIRVKYSYRTPTGKRGEMDSIFTVKDSKVLGVAPTPPDKATD